MTVCVVKGVNHSDEFADNYHQLSSYPLLY